MKNTLIIILAVLVLIFGYFAFKSKTNSVNIPPTPNV